MAAKRVTIVTSGHPSTCPRMVKAADAAVEQGYDVRLISVDYIEWATALDRALVQRRSWQWRPISLQRAAHPIASRWVSARHRAARSLALHLDPAHTPAPGVAVAFGRTHAELLGAILEEPFDFLYGGTVGALAATAAAASRAKKPFALDFEDFHPAESEEADAELTNALATRVVRESAQNAAFTTAASGPMADTYASRCGMRPMVVHNVVARPAAPPPRRRAADRLKLYWFSQVIGPKRGLEEIIHGVAAAGIDAELHLRGASRDEYVTALRGLARERGARLDVIVHAPGAPDEMVELCAPFDVGLSPEQEGVLNRALCLPNKPLTYLAAGLAVVATATPGQQTLAEAAGEGIWWYRPGDVATLAEGLRRWHRDPDALARARCCSYRAAVERFHWEHPLERGALLGAIEQAIA